MNQNNDVDSELQRAIDDITNNNSTPGAGKVDPVAAPSMVEPGTENKLEAAVGPFPKVEPPELPKIETKKNGAQFAPAPAPAADGIMPPGTGGMDAQNFENKASVEAEVAKLNKAAGDAEKSGNQNAKDASIIAENVKKVKEEALRDLIPLVEKLDMSAEEKFGIYQDILETLGEQSAVQPAYETAKAIADEKARGEALVYIVEKIDQLEK